MDMSTATPTSRRPRRLRRRWNPWRRRRSAAASPTPAAWCSSSTSPSCARPASGPCPTRRPASCRPAAC
ncbi:hypothetical protein EXJ73_20615 [Pelomonas aquatica]|uniref:Uncharacterized protein n=1 Tax=Pelomonas aquatica TaxID=431058 RepID=A0A9X4R6K1_9BURK|nr:hypothetical protein [Pelomonas aquatica]